jgi:hypothetical protein
LMDFAKLSTFSLINLLFCIKGSSHGFLLRQLFFDVFSKKSMLFFFGLLKLQTGI